ncbi:hydrogenase maturation protease [Escherichia coli]|nr:hydrogenase maturation protease [Escherichia coli]
MGKKKKRGSRGGGRGGGHGGGDPAGGGRGLGGGVAGRVVSPYHWPEVVGIGDGGTQGLNLLGYVESASHLLILDAIDYGLEPGTLRTYAGERIPAYLSAKKMSLHQNSFSEVLALADIRGHLPAHIALVGLQPAMLDDYGGNPSELAPEQPPTAEQAWPGAMVGGRDRLPPPKK